MKLYILLLLLVLVNNSEPFFYKIFYKKYISRYDLDRISSNIVGPKEKNNTKNIKTDYNFIERSNITYF